MTIAQDELRTIQSQLRELQDALREDPWNGVLWRKRCWLLNAEIQARHEIIADGTPIASPEFGERRGDYIWTTGDADGLSVLSLDFWHYSPLKRGEHDDMER